MISLNVRLAQTENNIYAFVIHGIQHGVVDETIDQWRDAFVKGKRLEYLVLTRCLLTSCSVTAANLL